MRVAILLLIAFKIIVILKINIHNTCRAVSSQVQHVLALILLSWKAIFRAGRLEYLCFEYLQKSLFSPIHPFESPCLFKL